MARIVAWVVIALAPAPVTAQETVSFRTVDGGTIYRDVRLLDEILRLLD